MSLKLKKPNIQIKNNLDIKKSDTARFIAKGDRRPEQGKKLTPSTFRLPRFVIDLLEDEANRIGQNKTMILKAAILAYSDLDENIKNAWLIESLKI
ncbi:MULTISPECIES: CopG family transcriptional regulator [Arsenophonus]|uniref:CopG family transcriptional regulator n=1 Tax=Arsenophonus TaxID=637 RepID=UPI00387A0255